MNSYTDYEAQHWDSRIITVTTWYSWLLTKDSLLSLSIITVLFCQTLVVHSLYIVGDRTKMVGNRSPRQVLSVYQRLRPPDGGEGTSSPPAARAGPGRPSTGRGRAGVTPGGTCLLPRLSTSRRTCLLPQRTTWWPR